MSEKIPDNTRNTARKKVSRRSVLGGLAAFAAASTMPTHTNKEQPQAPKLPPVAEREKDIGRFLELSFRENARRIVESGTDEEIIELLYAFPEYLMRADFPYYEGTRYDPMVFFAQQGGFPSVQLRSPLFDESITDARKYHVGNLEAGTVVPQSGYGNGFAVRFARNGENHVAVLTNKHVAEPLHLQPVSRTPAELDVAVVPIPTPLRGLPPPLEWNAEALPEDLTGMLVFNPTIRPDETTPDHYKVRAGIALKVTPHLLDFILRHQTSAAAETHTADTMFETTKKQWLRSYVVAAPFGEHVPRPIGTYGQGTSGSPWLIRADDGTMRLAGINYAGGIMTKGPFGTEPLIGFSMFHGPDAIAETLDAMP